MKLPAFLPLHRIVTLLIAFLIIFTVVQNTKEIKQLTQHNIVADRLDNHSDSQALRQLIIQIPQWHLFGIAPVTPENLMQTNLQLSLNGVMTNNNKTGAFAIIGEPGKDQKLYTIGDALPGGATLSQIDSHGVVIQYNGELQQLPLLKPGQ
jgi:general secretion pathway protein C